MHILVAFHISHTGDGVTQEYANIHMAVIEAIVPGGSSSDHHDPLPTAHVVRLHSASDREVILARLDAVARKYPYQLEYLVTPVMAGGSYDGRLHPEDWETLNRLSKQEGIFARLGRIPGVRYEPLQVADVASSPSGGERKGHK